MPGTVVQQRITHVASLCDLNHDGVLERADFEIWVDRMAAIRGWEAGSDDYERLSGLFLGSYLAGAGAVGAPDGEMPVSALADALGALAEAGDPRFSGWAAGFFDLLDA